MWAPLDRRRFTLPGMTVSTPRSKMKCWQSSGSSVWRSNTLSGGDLPDHVFEVFGDVDLIVHPGHFVGMQFWRI